MCYIMDELCNELALCVCTCMYNTRVFVFVYKIVHLKINLSLCLNIYGSTIYVKYQNKKTNKDPQTHPAHLLSHQVVKYETITCRLKTYGI